MSWDLLNRTNFRYKWFTFYHITAFVYDFYVNITCKSYVVVKWISFVGLTLVRFNKFQLTSPQVYLQSTLSIFCVKMKEGEIDSIENVNPFFCVSVIYIISLFFLHFIRLSLVWYVKTNRQFHLWLLHQYSITSPSFSSSFYIFLFYSFFIRYYWRCATAAFDICPRETIFYTVTFRWTLHHFCEYSLRFNLICSSR